MLMLIRIHIFLPFYYTATNMTSIGMLIKFLGEIYKQMFLFSLDIDASICYNARV